MWKTEIKTPINGSIHKVWKILVTPNVWIKVDPKHYKKVTYSKPTLEVGLKGKMAAEGSQTFSFKPVVIDEKKFVLVTESPIPLGKLKITKSLVQEKNSVMFEEEVLASGPFAKLFSKLFFKKQIEASLPAQHKAIKDYVEKV